MNIPEEDRKSIALAQNLNERLKERPEVEPRIDLANLAEELAKRKLKNMKKKK